MKKFNIAFIATGLSLLCFFAKAQGQNEQDKVYNFVSMETPPSFPGGIAKFYDFLGKNIKYPEAALQNKTQGNVFLSFVVEKDGSLTDIKVEKGLGNGTDEEAVRVLKLSKKWNPGQIEQKPVRTKYNIPIRFTLNNSSSLPSKPGKDIATMIIKAFSSGAPLIMINKVQSNMNNVLELSPNKVNNIQFLQAAQATKELGEKGKNGAVVITTAQ
ncbi:energy transducer TonB [Pedobacter montanisoli]|uniref:Energy transducer TonB n=1 Tax=Pedobacter montanisoli TaxID=2923277 RepID=A0ABS9ZUN0_9SPHI|nr:energy transducer TonB [Pedobacter montanisoli]MCJ0742018.1 energy transducer TonB [Pedobacter montanisoli]